MNKIFFKKINHNDCDEIFILQQKNKEDFGNNIWKAEELSTFIKDNTFEGIVFVHQKKINGFCFFKKIDNFIEIYSLFVDPKHRNKGIAGNILKQCIYYCKTNKLSKIILDVNENNLTAIKLYRKNNFVFCGKRKNYYNNREYFEDSYTMNLII